MRILIVATAALVLAIAGSLFAQDRLERPVTGTSTGDTINITFTLGTLGFVQDVYVNSAVVGINTGSIYTVHNSTGFTNLIATWIFTNQPTTRIDSPHPVQKDDVVRCVLTRSAIATNNTVAVWFKNVIK